MEDRRLCYCFLIIANLQQPLVKPSRVAPEIHGVSGLDGTDLLLDPDEDCVLKNEKAVLHMAQVLRDHPTKVTIVAVGPYTNIALLLTLFPELKSKIERISLMGGGIHSGNTTPVAEFNVLVSNAVLSHVKRKSPSECYAYLPAP
jgi:inosine-uridine nucleoside N-ribohydrolase